MVKWKQWNDNRPPKQKRNKLRRHGDNKNDKGIGRKHQQQVFIIWKIKSCRSVVEYKFECALFLYKVLVRTDKLQMQSSPIVWLSRWFCRIFLITIWSEFTSVSNILSHWILCILLIVMHNSARKCIYKVLCFYSWFNPIHGSK